jgi:hypothetical protein
VVRILRLPANFLGTFVVAKAQEDWLTEFVVLGPFGERDLCNELGLQERHFPSLDGIRDEWGRGLNQRLELSA